MASLELQLSKEPVLGKYTITTVIDVSLPGIILYYTLNLRKIFTKNYYHLF